MSPLLPQFVYSLRRLFAEVRMLGLRPHFPLLGGDLYPLRRLTIPVF